MPLVEVCYATADEAWRVTVELGAEATVRDAVAASALVERLQLDMTTLRFGVFGKLATPDASLRDGDRVEIYRPLIVDPKDARRRRVIERSGTRRKS